MVSVGPVVGVRGVDQVSLSIGVLEGVPRLPGSGDTWYE